MKFAVVVVVMNRRTRRCVGKGHTDVVDTLNADELFREAKTPLAVEQCYENFSNNLNPKSADVVKVVDVRRLPTKKRGQSHRRIAKV